MSSKQEEYPHIKWDNGSYFVSLPMDDGKNVIEAKWEPEITYIVRIRKYDDEKWSFGFETPLTVCNFVDLKPNQMYMMKVSHGTDQGERVIHRIRGKANQKGEFGNIEPFDEFKFESNIRPKVIWSGKMFLVSLTIDGNVVNARWQPSVTSVIRLRKVGDKHWSVGFETPLTGTKTVDLEADTKYQMQLTHKSEYGESEPAYAEVRTKPGVDI